MLTVNFAFRRAQGLMSLIGDRSGIKFLEDGECLARKHGVQGQ